MADIPARLRLRQATSVQWASTNPILALGEPAFETDTKRMRIGDGTTAFLSLPYVYTTGSNPDLAGLTATSFLINDATPYAGSLNSLTGRRLTQLTTGFSNAWTGAATGDFVITLTIDGNNAVQLGMDAKAAGTLWRRAQVANVWGAWDAVVTLTGTQTISGNKTFTGSTVLSGTTTIATLLSTLLSGGYTSSAVFDGTPAAGSIYRPDPLAASPGNMRNVINNGAFTLAAPNRVGEYTMIVQITNGATAGAITLSGFSKATGVAFSLTNGASFLLFITKASGAIFCNTVALQ